MAALGFLAKSSEHCVKSTGATREEKNEMSKRTRVESCRREGNGG
jgi:hypothetical protein